MKMKRTLSTVMASAIALSGFSVLGASAEAVENTVGDNGTVSGNAGMYFQTDMYTAHDAIGGTWGPDGGPLACFPNTVVGINGGEFGWDSKADVPTTTLSGDGTYTVSFKTNGVIDTAAPSTSKKWFLDSDQKFSRMGAPWSILGNYLCTSDLTQEGLTQEDLQWEFATKNRDKAFSFYLLGVTTDIPAFYDEETGKCYLDEAKTREVTVSDVSVDMCGKTFKAGEVKFQQGDYLQLSMINTYGEGNNSIDPAAFPEQDGVITVSFNIKGLSEQKKEEAKTDLSKKGKLTVSKKKVAYTGKALKPAVTVKADGKTLKSGTDYTVAYKNNKKPGKATVTVTGKGSYTGKLSGSFIITPKKQAAPTVKALGKSKVKITVKKDKLASGYKVQYSTDKKFKKGVKTITLKKNTKTTKTVKLKKGKKYFVRSAAYVKVGKTAYAGKFSKAVKVK